MTGVANENPPCNHVISDENAASPVLMSLGTLVIIVQPAYKVRLFLTVSTSNFHSFNASSSLYQPLKLYEASGAVGVLISSVIRLPFSTLTVWTI